ncbi:MAG: hypothetical protein JNL38_13460 [Myxococcales bacterium]|jgi:hypothetical protein|nr:hypothetical protein [Myxococcales bacterium]
MARGHTRRLGRTATLVTVAAVAGIAAAPAARADTKAVCAAASEHGQRMRLARRLPQALEDFEMCAKDSCPDVVARDCRAWLAEVRDLVATIVLVARSAAGDDVRDARVFVDGELRATALERQTLLMAAGRHTLRIEAPGYAPAEEALLLGYGEQGRVVEVLLRKAAAPPPPESPPPPPAAPSSVNVPPLVVAGVGASALVVGGALMVVAVNRLPAGCDFATERCNRRVDEAVVPDGRVADASSAKDVFWVGLGLTAIGAVVTGGGLAWYALRPRAAAAGWPTFGVAAAPGWAGVGLRGPF